MAPETRPDPVAPAGPAGPIGSAGPETSPTAEPQPTQPPVQPASAYNITVRYIGNSATPRQKQAVEAAVAQWQSVITGDLPEITAVAEANACFDGQPAVNERIDDILIYVEFVDIDGPGQILGEAGPCYIRNVSNLPVLGRLELDQSDLARMEQNGTMDAVVLHEIGHILGIGTLWPVAQLLSGAGGADPRFTGRAAIDAYHVLGGSDPEVPVEGLGADGTRDGHWRESVFGNELMTGYIGGSTNPMSGMTIASLHDLGYNTNQAAAASYSFATSLQHVTASVDLHAGERMLVPRFLVDRNGVRTEIHPQTVTTPWRQR
jgi:hypothetical protein